MAYAHKTKVPTDQSRMEIERVCRKYGCTAFASGWQEDSASVSFAVKDRRVVFKLGLPKRDDREIRRRWRCLLLAIKSKLECVASGIETFEQAFLAHIVTETGQTVYERLVAPGSTVKLLAAPEKD